MDVIDNTMSNNSTISHQTLQSKVSHIHTSNEDAADVVLNIQSTSFGYFQFRHVNSCTIHPHVCTRIP